MSTKQRMSTPEGDLSVTALYTAQTWSWGELSYAHLFATPASKRVFDATNAVLAAAGLFKRGAAPLRNSLLHRHVMIDHLLRTSECRRVIELAAGLSRRGAAFTGDPRMHYTEVDLPRMIRNKRELLERTPEGREVLGRSGLHLLEANVETVELPALAAAGEPVFVIAEGLVMYLAADARQRLFAKIRRLAEHAGDLRFVFDLVPAADEPEPGRVGRVLEAAMKRFTGGRGFERDARTRADVLAELRAAGFDDAEAISSREVAAAWQLPDPGQRTTMVVFTCRARGASRATPR
jgi:O-methyltransferase involved in polyketide biosynthesis